MPSSHLVRRVLGACSLLALLTVPSGCDSEGGQDLAGVIGSQYVPFTLTMEQVVDGTLSASVSIQPQSFLQSVRSKLGHDPTRVELSKVTFELPPGGLLTGVSHWGDVFSDEVRVALITQGGSAPVLVAKGPRPATGLATWNLPVVLPSGTLDRYPEIAQGRFNVVLNAETLKRDGDPFRLTLRVALEFMAF